MSYLVSFLPWIVYAVVPSSQWRWAALAALAITAGQIVWYRRARRPLDAMIIELGSTVFFLAAAVLAFADPHTALHRYAPAAATGWLAVIAWVSIAIGRPFTLGIAKLGTPREVWDLPQFRRVNVTITLVWAGAFTLGFAALAVAEGLGVGTLVDTIIQVISLAAPAVFTVRYTAYVRSRAAAARIAAERSAQNGGPGRGESQGGAAKAEVRSHTGVVCERADNAGSVVLGPARPGIPFSEDL